MRERAIVVKATGKIAIVRIEKRPECDGCKLCAFKAGKSTVKVKALNRAGAGAGDRVIVQAEKDNRLLASIVVYGIPVVLACVGVLLGALAFKSQLLAAVLCLVGLALGFFAVFLVDKLAAKSRGFGMEVVEICQNTEKEQEETTDGSKI